LAESLGCQGFNLETARWASVEAEKIVGQDACRSAKLTGKELSFGSSTKGADLALPLLLFCLTVWDWISQGRKHGLSLKAVRSTKSG
jgi:hypothetical protein